MIFIEKNYFEGLYAVDFSNKTKTKKDLTYIPWAAAWAEVKKRFPDATYKVHEQHFETETFSEEQKIYTSYDRPWFDDGRSAWVITGVTINGIEYLERLPIMDFKNQAIIASKVMSTDANKAIQRSITKACARHGIGLYIYESEDLPEEVKELDRIRNSCWDLIKKRSGLSPKTSEKVGEICKGALKEENGDPRLCEDVDILKKLEKELRAVRKIV